MSVLRKPYLLAVQPIAIHAPSFRLNVTMLLAIMVVLEPAVIEVRGKNDNDHF